MIREILLQRFNEETTGKNHSDGKRILENQLVSSMNINEKDNLVYIEGTVISENLFSEYHGIIYIDNKNKGVISTRCTCDDYCKRSLNKKNYCCKHLVAIFYMALDELENGEIFAGNDEISYEDDYHSTNNILNLLLNEEKEKEEIKLEVYINRNKRTNDISAELRIGTNKMSSFKLYVVKDIKQFLIYYHNNMAIKYGNNFIFNMDDYYLGTKDKRLIEFIETLNTMDHKGSTYKEVTKLLDGKFINIPPYLIREFFERIKGHRVFLNEGFFGKALDGEIVFEAPPMNFRLSTKDNNFLLEYNDVLPECFGKNKDVFLYGTTVYLPSYEFCYDISPYMKVFNNSRAVIIPIKEESKVLLELIPRLNTLSYNLSLSEDIRDKIVIESVKFKFYMDKEDENIILILKVAYGIHEFNVFQDYDKKVIYREFNKEHSVIETLRSLGFEIEKNRFIITYGDDFKFNFLKDKLKKLQDIGEIYYSENFKGIKAVGSKGIKSQIRAGKYDYFEMTYKIDGLSMEENCEILRAFRDNLKYYKLKSGEFIDLCDDDLEKFLRLVDSLSKDDFNDNIIEINPNKALYINEYIKDTKLNCIKGTKALKEISSRFSELSKMSFSEPEQLKGVLRPYQKVGFNWFKTLEYLGFGGILGDEMGLGKTLQAISFIVSKKDTKTLILAPTSLVYNWSNEFSKFNAATPTPGVNSNSRVVICNGTVEEREKMLKNFQEYDVIITTYNLLKRDIERYENINFDYCILDEAQFIKNPHSQNAISVKKIKAKNRFALTGTPIENSLMELWSIFDFVMPGYLYDEKRFSVRYEKRLREAPEIIEELNKLIKPFILRRKKKDVIRELPDKIENYLMVSLTYEQQKVYSTYAKYAKDLIEKKVRDDEFKKDKIEILSYITKLRQLCLDPSVVIKDYEGESGKIEALIELLSNTMEEGHRILVFSQFTSVLKNIGKRLNNENIGFNYLDGSMSSEKRMEEVQDFNSGNKSVFLISLKAGGTGLNLTSADIVVHFDPWWNPAVEDQATDRAHRIGQKNVVEVVKIVAKGSIEEKIIALQEEKRNLIGKIIDEEDYSGNNLMSLSDEDMIELFRYEE